jgi:hypothetical protein
MTGETEGRIRAKLYNNYPGYRVIEKISVDYEPIIVNDKQYPSIDSAVAAGEAKDRFEAMRRLKNPKYKNWNYVSLAKRIDKTNKK